MPVGPSKVRLFDWHQYVHSYSWVSRAHLEDPSVELGHPASRHGLVQAQDADPIAGLDLVHEVVLEHDLGRVGHLPGRGGLGELLDGNNLWEGWGWRIYSLVG